MREIEQNFHQYKTLKDRIQPFDCLQKDARLTVEAILYVQTLCIPQCLKRITKNTNNNKLSIPYPFERFRSSVAGRIEFLNSQCTWTWCWTLRMSQSRSRVLRSSSISWYLMTLRVTAMGMIEHWVRKSTTKRERGSHSIVIMDRLTCLGRIYSVCWPWRGKNKAVFT